MKEMRKSLIYLVFFAALSGSLPALANTADTKRLRLVPSPLPMCLPNEVPVWNPATSSYYCVPTTNRPSLLQR